MQVTRTYLFLSRLVRACDVCSDKTAKASGRHHLTAPTVDKRAIEYQDGLTDDIANGFKMAVTRSGRPKSAIVNEALDRFLDPKDEKDQPRISISPR
jgi:hypothetical protein